MPDTNDRVCMTRILSPCVSAVGMSLQQVGSICKKGEGKLRYDC